RIRIVRQHRQNSAGVFVRDKGIVRGSSRPVHVVDDDVGGVERGRTVLVLDPPRDGVRAVAGKGEVRGGGGHVEPVGGVREVPVVVEVVAVEESGGGVGAGRVNRAGER